MTAVQNHPRVPLRTLTRVATCAVLFLAPACADDEGSKGPPCTPVQSAICRPYRETHVNNEALDRTTSVPPSALNKDLRGSRVKDH